MKPPPPTWGARKHQKGERSSEKNNPENDCLPLEDPLGVYYDLAVDMIGNHHENLTREFLRGFCAMQQAFNARAFGDVTKKHCRGIHIIHDADTEGYCRHPLCPSCWLKRELVIRDTLTKTPAPPRWIYRESSTFPLREFDSRDADKAWEAFRARYVRSLTPLVWSLEITQLEEGYSAPVTYDELTNLGFRYRGIFSDSGGGRYKSIPVMCSESGVVPTPIGNYGFIFDTPCKDAEMLTEWREHVMSPVKVISDFMHHAALPVIPKKVHLGKQFYALSMKEKKSQSVEILDTGGVKSPEAPVVH
jgi:hypothetical protein